MSAAVETTATTPKTPRRKPANRFRVKAGDPCPECEKGIMQPDSGCVCCDACAYSPCAG